MLRGGPECVKSYYTNIKTTITTKERNKHNEDVIEPP
jgi:hypothetical protein